MADGSCRRRWPTWIPTGCRPQLAVSYALPQRLMRRTRVFSGMTVSLVARNLFFIYNAAPFDPDLVLSTGNDNQGIDVYGMPTVRSFGFNIKLEF